MAAALVPFMLLPSFLFLAPPPVVVASAPNSGSGDTPLPPGTVTNLAGKTTPQPSCRSPKTAEPLSPANGWSTTMDVPQSVFAWKTVGANSTETFALAADGTLGVSDGNDSFTLAPLAGLPSGNASSSIMANSTAAVQTFTVTAKNGKVAEVAVTYSTVVSSCYPAGLRMEISGDVDWNGGSGTVSIPFESQPTFSAVTRTAANASAPYTPTRATFGHGKKASLAFDWSDSKKLNPTYDNATNSLDFRVGDSFLIDPLVAYTTNRIALKTDYEGLTCYAGGRYWVFYDTGANEEMASSADLNNWVLQPFNVVGDHGLMGFYCSGDTLYYVAAASSTGDGIYYGFGILEPNGTYHPSIPEGYIPVPYQFVRGPSTVVDSSGAWWFAIGEGPIEVWRCADPSACVWTQSASINWLGYPDLVPLTGGKMAVVWTTLGYNTVGEYVVSFYDGTTWLPPVEQYSYGIEGDATTCVSIGDVVECAAPWGNEAGYIYASYGEGTPYWSSFTPVASCIAPCFASMSTDGRSDLVMTYAGQDGVGYSESFDSGKAWGPPIFLSQTVAGRSYLDSPYNLDGHVMAAWTESQSYPLPYAVSFGVSLVQYPAGPTPPWAEPGLSPYESYVNNAVVYVSMGTGLLSIEQPTFALPGRGLSVAPTLFYSEPGAFQFGGNETAEVDNFTLANVGLGWSLNIPWLGTYAVHLPDGGEYPYQWKGTDMQVHGPVDFELTSTGANGVCPCTLTLPSGVQFSFSSTRQLSTEADPTGRNVVSFSYGTNGMLSTIIDTVGRATSFSYDGANQLVGITAPGGRLWTLGYAGDELTSIADPVGRVTAFRYDSHQGNGWLVGEVDYPTGGAKVTLVYGEGYVADGMSYVVNGRNICSAANAISQSNAMSYYFENGTLLSAGLSEAGGDQLLQGVVAYSYLPSAGMELTTFYNAKSTTLQNPQLTAFQVTENDYSGGRLVATKTESPSKNVLAESDYAYDGWGNVVYTKDDAGQQTWMSYSGVFSNLNCQTFGFYLSIPGPNIHDRLLGTCDFQDASGTVQQEAFYQYNHIGELTETKVSHNGGWLYTDYTYDAYGNVLSAKDADGNTVYYAYSPTYGSAYLTAESRAVGSAVIVTRYAYDLNTGFLTSTTDPNGQTTTTAYDAVGRELSETYPAVNGIGSVVSYSYDDVNGVVTVTDPNFNVVKHYFDGLGRETQLLVLNDKGKDYSDTRYAYNWMDKVSSVLTPPTQACPSGCNYSYTYDSIGRPLSQTNPDGTASTVYYNDITNTATTKDEDGNQATTSYDWGGKVTAVLQFASPSTPVETSYAYDKAGNLLSTTNADGQTTSYVYDDLNRLVQATGPDGNSTSYAYDAIGNLVSKTTADGATMTYAYDAADRLTGIGYPGGAVTSYSYDLDGNVLAVSSTLSGSTQDSFTYDSMDRLTSSTVSVAGGSYTTSYGYDQASNVVSMTYPDGLVVPMTYDFENRLTKVGPYATFSYNTDGTLAQTAFGDKEVQSYAYDGRDRVTSIVDALHNKTPVVDLAYSYDAAGNVVGLNSEAFAYDGLNRLVSASGGWGTTTYSYDGAGNMLASDTNGVTTGYSGCGYYPDGVTANAWISCSTDKDGNIVQKASAGGAWTYSYDAEGEMTNAAFNGVVQQTNVYDGLGDRVEETAASGSSVFAYKGVNLLFERNLTSGVETDHVYGDGMQLAEVGGGATRYLHEDAVGSDRAETSVAKGKVDLSFSSGYQPYGQGVAANGSGSFRFADRMLDSATGLYYFNARFYDPSTMRFMQKDPGGTDAASPYMYADDNPLSYTDPTGMFSTGMGGLANEGQSFFTQAYNWYRWHVWDAPDRLSCDSGDEKACTRVMTQVVMGLAGGADVEVEVVIRAASFEEAGAGLGKALVNPEIMRIRLLLDPTSEDFAPWFEAFHETSDMGTTGRAFIAKLLRSAGYEVDVGEPLDIFAKGRVRSLLLESKARLNGGVLGNQEKTQLEGYLTASTRRNAQRWLGIMGVDRPTELSGDLKSAMRAGNIGLLEARWVLPGPTLEDFG